MRFVIDTCPKCGEMPVAIDEFVNTEYVLELQNQDGDYNHGDSFTYDESRTAAKNKEHARLRCGDRDCNHYWDTPIVGKEAEAEAEERAMRIRDAAPEMFECLKNILAGLWRRTAMPDPRLEAARTLIKRLED